MNTLTGYYKEDAPEKHLRGKRALLMESGNLKNKYKAQFDDLYLIEAFGWREYPKKHFRNVTRIGDV